ncbi:hypothetical protein SBA1_640012 [Candidatus Sulfotelmatobacter kueseliae]|uniref:Uncharacterized protein n=1 Tax=Candidatus Sulfotelmatobacter kueseliae TaxID=2042962 RepID=A0A2U3L2Q2_9BACT|nr:hypothetical protein SBA1_640012 [Candidatus Sulfotelmatobacter kueseliae]
MLHSGRRQDEDRLFDRVASFRTTNLRSQARKEHEYEFRFDSKDICYAVGLSFFRSWFYGCRLNHSCNSAKFAGCKRHP